MPNTHSLLLLAVYSLLIVGSSMLGGWLPTRLRWSHTAMQCVLSFVGGFMLGIALLHMLPHGAVACGSLDVVLGSCLVGLLVTFLMIRLFDFHQHGHSGVGNDSVEHAHRHSASCDHPHHPETHSIQSAVAHGSHDAIGLGRSGHSHPSGGPHPYTWTGMAFGLALHTLFDGIALGSAILTDATHPSPPYLLGLGVFAAIWLHKWLDALSISSLMMASGWPSASRNLVNLGFAMMCPLGAILVVLGLASFDVDQQRILGIAMGFSAGVFLCISLGDLLPELQFHRHDRIKLSLALLFGVALAYGIGMLEPKHSHAMQGGILLESKL